MLSRLLRCALEIAEKILLAVENVVGSCRGHAWSSHLQQVRPYVRAAVVILGGLLGLLPAHEIAAVVLALIVGALAHPSTSPSPRQIAGGFSRSKGTFMTTSEHRNLQPIDSVDPDGVRPSADHLTATTALSVAEEAVGTIALKPAALSLQQRDDIRAAAVAYAEACSTQQRYLGTGSDQTGVEAVDTTLNALNRLLDLATSTSVDTALLERTLQRDALIVEREALAARDAALAIEREGLKARIREVTVDRDRLQDVRNAGEDETDLLLQRHREMAKRCEQLSATAASAEAAFEVFKRKVVEVADEYAQEHGWCSVIDQALEDLGLERSPKEYRAKLTITVDVYGVLARGRRDLPEGDWVRDSIGVRGIERAIRDHIAFDDDHLSGSVDAFEFEVDDVQDND
jgi:hypothetical protein